MRNEDNDRIRMAEKTIAMPREDAQRVDPTSVRVMTPLRGHKGGSIMQSLWITTSELYILPLGSFLRRSQPKLRCQGRRVNHACSSSLNTSTIESRSFIQSMHAAMQEKCFVRSIVQSWVTACSMQTLRVPCSMQAQQHPRRREGGIWPDDKKKERQGCLREDSQLI
jgi:hypothetical protein